MKKKIILLSVGMCICLILTSSCGKKDSTKPDATVTTKPDTTATTKPDVPAPTPTIEVTPIAHHNVKTINLGTAANFAIMAYTSITSSPTSNIVGKVGLKPGIRSLINLNLETEVVGGATEVYAGDDIGASSDYLNFARENLIEAYRDAVSRPFDSDKLEAYAGILDGKILIPGIYRWTKGVKISSDMTIEGNDSDVFIFQIAGDLNIAPKVRIVLSGNVQAKNIFWQVSGKVTLGSNSIAQGTIMSQLTFEMKNFAQLNGRAFVKNGKILLSQNVITAPVQKN